MKVKHLISIFDFDAAEIKTIFELTRKIKRNPSAYKDLLKGKVLGLIFEKPSTRTRVSFEVGFSTLGGYVTYLGPDDIRLGVREETRDIARVLGRYVDGVVLRTFSHRTIAEFARYFEKPVINGLSDFEHPCQALGDFFTILELFRTLEGTKISYVGDGNNVCHSLLLLASRLGAHFSAATPSAYAPSEKICQLAREEAKKTKAKLELSRRPAEAVKGADVVYTDVWVSMGQEEKSAEKRKAFQGFQVNESLLRSAKKSVRVMHCLPAHRGEEITDSVLESENSVVFDQAENRLHVERAILIYLLGHVPQRAASADLDEHEV